MRGRSSTITLHRPATLAETYACLADQQKNWQLLAGGTDLMVQHESGAHTGACWLSLDRLEELATIELHEKEVQIGATVSYLDLQRSLSNVPELWMLREAARLTGARAIQARGTLGGNIANASPAADSVPALMALDARLLLGSQSGRREIQLSEFYRGYRDTILEPGELIEKIIVPRRQDRFSFYRKVGTRRSQAISKVVMAASWLSDGSNRDFHLAFGSVAPVTLRCPRTEELLKSAPINNDTIQQACRLLQEEISPIDDIRSTADYRRRVSANLLAACLHMIKGESRS